MSQARYIAMDESLIFCLIRNAVGCEVPLVDRDIILLLSKYEDFSLTYPQDLKGTRSLAFFAENKDTLYFVQDGEYLSFHKLDTLRPFIAHGKNSVGTSGTNKKSLREVLVYKPDNEFEDW